MGAWLGGWLGGVAWLGVERGCALAGVVRKNMDTEPCDFDRVNSAITAAAAQRHTLTEEGSADLSEIDETLCNLRVTRSAMEKLDRNEKFSIQLHSTIDGQEALISPDDSFPQTTRERQEMSDKDSMWWTKYIPYFVNSPHADEKPNIIVVPLVVKVNGVFVNITHVGVALVDITAGSELVWDYGDDYQYEKCGMPQPSVSRDVVMLQSSRTELTSTLKGLVPAHANSWVIRKARDQQHRSISEIQHEFPLDHPIWKHSFEFVIGEPVCLFWGGCVGWVEVCGGVVCANRLGGISRCDYVQLGGPG